MSTNDPTKAGWKNPYWGSTPDWARPIFENLSEFLARPTFLNGIEVGNGTLPSKDPDTGVVQRPPVSVIDKPNFDQALVSVPNQEVLDALANLDTDGATLTQNLAAMQVELDALKVQTDALKTSPIAFTRVTDVSISTPMLQANSIIASKIGVDQVLAQHVKAAQIDTLHLKAGAVTVDKLAAMYLSVGKFIRSANYNGTTSSNGTQGWAIDGGGNAVFMNVTVRGTVFGSAIHSSAIYVRDEGSRLRIFIGEQTDRITFYNADGVSSSMYQGTSNGLWTSGSLRSLANLYSDGFVAIGGSAVFLTAPTHTNLHLGGSPGARDGNLNCAAIYNSDGVFVVSDRAIKSHIRTEEEGMLGKVVDTPVRRYEHRDVAAMGISPGEEKVGWVAQEVPAEAQGETNGFVAVRLDTMLATLWGAVQELDKKVEALT